jgi:hypothetical protein
VYLSHVAQCLTITSISTPLKNLPSYLFIMFSVSLVAVIASGLALNLVIILIFLGFVEFVCIFFGQ